MCNCDKIKLLKEFLGKRYKSEAGVECWWEHGNYDDTFEQGQRLGQRDALWSIIKLLELEEEFESPEEFNMEDYY